MLRCRLLLAILLALPAAAQSAHMLPALPSVLPNSVPTTTTTGSAEGYTNAGSLLTSALPSCTVTNGLEISQRIAISSSVTVPASCPLRFVPGGELLPSSGVNVTINGSIQALPTQQIFAGAGSISGLRGDIPVAWFGAYPQSTMSAAASQEMTSAIQATIDSLTSGRAELQAGYYGMRSCGLSIKRSVVGMKGMSGGYSYPADSPASILLCSSASATILSLTGTASSPLAWNSFDEFSVQRTVMPALGSKGIVVSFAGGYSFHHIQSHDSAIDFYAHSAPDYGIGGFRDVNAGWSCASVTKYGSSVPLVGYDLDSSDGNSESTILLDHASVGNCGATAPTSTAFLIHGTAINDIDIRFANVSRASFGVDVDYTGTGAQGTAYDVHVENGTFDNCSMNCVRVQNIPINGSVNFVDLYATSTGTVPAVQLTNSYNTSIQGAEIANVGSGGGLSINGGGTNIVHGMKGVVILGGNGIYLGGTNHNLLSDIVLVGSSSAPMTSMVGLGGGSTGNQILNVVGAGSATNGVYADANSTGNGFCNVSFREPLRGASTTCSGTPSSSQPLRSHR